MEYINLHDYAKEKGVSYEAIRKQVNRYKKELRDHIVVKNRTQFLDEYAQDFLSEKRRTAPAIFRQENNEERISELERVSENLNIRLLETQDLLIKTQEELIAVNKQLLLERDKVIGLLETKEENIQLRAENDILTEKLSTAQEQRQTAEDTAQDTQKRLTDYEAQVTQWQADYQQQLDELSRQRDAAVEEAASYEKSWFGLYRKRG